MTAERAVRLTALGFVWNPEQNQNRDDARWEAQLARLAAYKAAHGDCSVPKGWAEDRPLGAWVMNQRVGKRKLDRGVPSHGMRAERAARLTALGFVWDQHEAEREAQLARLVAYQAAHGHCNVPRHWAEDPRLARWVGTQRELKRKLDRGEPSEGMTAERAARLTALGLVWRPSMKRRRSGGAAPPGGAFCRRSSPRVPPPPAVGEEDEYEVELGLGRIVALPYSSSI
jgi:hypothetical protein